MSAAKWGPSAVGIGALVATAVVLELLIRGGAINRYAVTAFAQEQLGKLGKAVAMPSPRSSSSRSAAPARQQT